MSSSVNRKRPTPINGKGNLSYENHAIDTVKDIPINKNILNAFYIKGPLIAIRQCEAATNCENSTEPTRRS